MRWIVGTVVVLHGLRHLLGAVEAFGWTQLPQLRQPIGRVRGLAWLVAAVLLVAARVVLAVALRG